MFVNIVFLCCIVFLVGCTVRFILLPALMMCFLILLALFGGIAYGLRMLFNAIINIKRQYNAEVK